jgi:hypothetical protein
MELGVFSGCQPKCQVIEIECLTGTGWEEKSGVSKNEGISHDVYENK